MVFNRAKRQAKKTAKENAVMAALEEELETALTLEDIKEKQQRLKKLRETVDHKIARIGSIQSSKGFSCLVPAAMSMAGGGVCVLAGLIDMVGTGAVITIASGLIAGVSGGGLSYKAFKICRSSPPLFHSLEVFGTKLDKEISKAAPAVRLKSALEEVTELSPELATRLQAEFELTAKKQATVNPAKPHVPLTLAQLKHSRLKK